MYMYTYIDGVVVVMNNDDVGVVFLVQMKRQWLMGARYMIMQTKQTLS